MALLTIPEDILLEAGLDERGALVEFACRLFHAEKISLQSAMRLTGLNRTGIDDALLQRGLAVPRSSWTDLAQELAALDRIER